MNTEEALRIVDQALASVVANRQVHVQIQEAFDTIKIELTKDVETPKADDSK